MYTISLNIIQKKNIKFVIQSKPIHSMWNNISKFLNE